MNLILNLIILLASWFIMFCLIFLVMLVVIISVPVLVFLAIVGSVVRKLCGGWFKMIMVCFSCYTEFNYSDRDVQLSRYPYCPCCGSGRTGFYNDKGELSMNN